MQGIKTYRVGDSVWPYLNLLLFLAFSSFETACLVSVTVSIPNVQKMNPLAFTRKKKYKLAMPNKPRITNCLWADFWPWFTWKFLYFQQNLKNRKFYVCFKNCSYLKNPLTDFILIICFGKLKAFYIGSILSMISVRYTTSKLQRLEERCWGGQAESPTRYIIT